MQITEHYQSLYAMLAGNKPADVSEIYSHMRAVAEHLEVEYDYDPQHEDYLHLRLL